MSRRSRRLTIGIALLAVLAGGVVTAVRTGQWYYGTLDGRIAATRMPFGADRAAACLDLAHYTTEPGRTRAAQAVVHCLDDRDNVVLASAASAVGNLRYHPAVPALTRLLQDERPGVSMAAMAALAMMHVTQAMPHMVRELRSSTNLAERRAAAGALGMMGTSDARNALARALGQERSQYVRQAIETALALPHGPTPRPAPSDRQRQR
jgi:HEAT repeat protein